MSRPRRDDPVRWAANMAKGPRGLRERLPGALNLLPPHLKVPPAPPAEAVHFDCDFDLTEGDDDAIV